MTDPSTKPYLIRAIHEWCVDNGYTPYLAVSVNAQTVVPKQFVKAGEIVLNASPIATNKLNLGNEWIEFQARFSGVVNNISVPVSQVSAIYARENGHGMAFEVPKDLAVPFSEQSDELDQGSAPELRPVSGVPAPELVPTGRGPDVADSPTNSKKSTKNSPEKRKNHLTRVK